MPKVIPALFPTLFGAVALAFLWQAHGAMLVGWVVSVIWVIAAGAYLLRVILDPKILSRDLDTLPGRTGLAAMNLTLMVIAGPLGTLWLLAGQVALVTALLVQCALIVAVGRRIIKADAAGKTVQPVWQMIFTGYVVAIPATGALGALSFAQALLGLSVGAACLIWALTVIMLLKQRFPPPQLRPALAIHLSPAAMIGLGALACGYVTLAWVFFGVATAIVVAMVVKAGWITSAGFSPFWGAFTFPFVAYTTLCFFVSTWLGWALLCLVTLIVTIIAVNIHRLWREGYLGTLTFAA